MLLSNTVLLMLHYADAVQFCRYNSVLNLPGAAPHPSEGTKGLGFAAIA